MTQCLSSSAYPTFSTSSPTSPVLLSRICGTTAGTQLTTAPTVSPVPMYSTGFFSRYFASLLHRCFILSLTDDSALPVLVLNLCRDKLSCYSCFFTVIVVLFALRFLSSMAHAVCCLLLAAISLQPCAPCTRHGGTSPSMAWRTDPQSVPTAANATARRESATALSASKALRANYVSFGVQSRSLQRF